MQLWNFKSIENKIIYIKKKYVEHKLYKNHLKFVLFLSIDKCGLNRGTFFVYSQQDFISYLLFTIKIIISIVNIIIIRNIKNYENGV